MKPLLPLLLCLLALPAWAIEYPIVLIESPVVPGFSLPEAGKPWPKQPGARLTRFEDGEKSVLVPVFDKASIFDARVSKDGKWVYYAICPDVTYSDAVYPPMPIGGSDIWKINVETGEKIKLTESVPEPFAGRTRPGGIRVFNMGPEEVAGDHVVFTSDAEIIGVNRLYGMDTDGKNREKTGFLNMANALHPVMGSDGRIYWSSHENQGVRSPIQWGPWHTYPDGSDFEPFFSAFVNGTVAHFHTEAGNHAVVGTFYYQVSNHGFGTFWSAPLQGGFEHLIPVPGYDGTNGHNVFARTGQKNLTPWTTEQDMAAPLFNPNDDPLTGARVGKVTHPSTAKDPNKVLCTYSSGPVNHAGRPVNLPWIQCGVYEMPIDKPTTGPGDLELVVDDPEWHEYQPQALLPYTDLFPEGAPEHPWLPNEGSEHLPEGTPYGIVGTSSIYVRETDALITNGVVPNLGQQGGNDKPFENSEIAKLRILTMEVPTGRHDYSTALNMDEKLRILGDIPLRKFKDGQPVLDPAGNPDTSFWAKIRADDPFTFQLIDADGRVLTTAMTWHHVRPGEIKTDCRGCHAHTQPEMRFDFEDTWAAAHDPVDLTKEPGRLVEYNRDIKPILTEHGCLDCHSKGTDGAPLLAFIPAPGVAQGNDARPYRNAVRPLWTPYESRYSKLIFHLTTDDLSKRMPRGLPAMPTEQVKLIAEWIDTGGLLGYTSGEEFRDDTKPTLYVSRTKVLIGAADAHLASVTATLNGTPLTLTENDGVYRPAAPAKAEGELIAVAKDEAGNETRIVRTFRGEVEPEPPPPPPDGTAALKAEIAELRQQIEAAIEALQGALE